jgi:hypothetical protein
MSNVTIKYGDHYFYTEGEYDEVCRAILDGKSLDVFQVAGIGERINSRITFFGDPDWVSVEL